mmetsp:Transcript_4406/g.5784  ORF Transcript_4406/g.5784 Transcript_4406/m.5784 type:complete len:154 (+) Transcript_4406:91-552(+)
MPISFDQPCVIQSCFCCYDAFDLNDIAVGCYHHRDFLCIRFSLCLALGVDSRGVGVVTESNKGEICKIGLYCCDLGLVKPKVLTAGFSKCLCCIDVCAIPQVPGYMDGLTFAMCCVQCYPTFEILASPPPCPAMNEFKSGGTPDPAIAELMNR